MILAGSLLPWPLGGLIQAGVWTIVLLIFFTRSEWVGVLSPGEYKFLEEYTGTLHEIRILKARVRDADPDEYLARFQQAVRTLERLDAPREWRRVHAAALDELRRRATRMALLAMPTAEEARIAAARWLEVEKDFNQLVRARAGFWTGWPLRVGQA
jgi:hypothetical protein